MKTNLFHNNINEMAIQRVYSDNDIQLSTVEEAKQQLEEIFNQHQSNINAENLNTIRLIITEYPELTNEPLNVPRYNNPRTTIDLIFSLISKYTPENKKYKKLLKVAINYSDNLEFDTTTTHRNITPLMQLVTYDDKELINMLIEKNVNLNAQNKNKETALHCAVKYDKPKNVELLLSEGADATIKNDQNYTPRTSALKLGLDKCYTILTLHNAPLS